MAKDNNPLEIEMSNERITDLATAAIRVNQHAAGIIRDMHRDATALDFFQVNVLLAAVAIHLKLSTVCECDRCSAEQSKLAALTEDRAMALLGAFVEQQNKGGE